MSINPKSVEFHQCHAKQHSICFFTTISKITKEIFVDEHTDSDSKVHYQFVCIGHDWRHYANELLVHVRLFFQNLLQTPSICGKYEKMFGKRVITRNRCR